MDYDLIKLVERAVHADWQIDVWVAVAPDATHSEQQIEDTLGRWIMTSAMCWAQVAAHAAARVRWCLIDREEDDAVEE